MTTDGCFGEPVGFRDARRGRWGYRGAPAAPGARELEGAVLAPSINEVFSKGP